MDNLMEQSSNINFVPCVRWVKRGVAKANPEKVQLNKEELLQVIAATKSKLRSTTTGDDDNEDDENEDDANDEQAPSANNPEDEFNLDEYDEEGETETFGIQNLASISAEQEDGNSDSDSEKEDDLIKPRDNLIVVGHVEGDASVLEVYIYNEDEGSLYVHHDLLLPSFPLCFEWLDYEPGHSSAGNLCAVGSMSPIIEVWDLDVVNCLEAAFSLGQAGSRRKRIKQVGHTDAVLDLAWNRSFHHILASGSVDKSVLLWDLDQGQPHTTLKVFGDKVQCLKWHPFEAQTLLAGSCDRTARVFDCRGDSTHQSWPTDGEVERIVWDPLQPFCFFAATSAGSVQCFDCRKGALWSVAAHEKEVTGLVISDKCKGLMVTTSGDGTLKAWDYSYLDSGSPPALVHTKEMQMGTIHCLELCPDQPFVVTCGGDNRSNNFRVLDLRSLEPVNHRFGSRSLVELVKDDVSTAEMENMSITN